MHAASEYLAGCNNVAYRCMAQLNEHGGFDYEQALHAVVDLRAALNETASRCAQLLDDPAGQQAARPAASDTPKGSAPRASTDTKIAASAEPSSRISQATAAATWWPFGRATPADNANDKAPAQQDSPTSFSLEDEASWLSNVDDILRELDQVFPEGERDIWDAGDGGTATAQDLAFDLEQPSTAASEAHEQCHRLPRQATAAAATFAGTKRAREDRW